MKVLDVGCGYESNAKIVWPEAEVTRLDANPEARPDVLHDITYPMPPELIEQFDVVLASHVIEHIERALLYQTFTNCIAALKPGGKLFVIVPSLEKACQEILKGKGNMAVHGMLYGGQQHPWDFHKSGWTLGALKGMFEIFKLRITQLDTSPFNIMYDEEPMLGWQNVCAGVKDGNTDTAGG